MTTWSVIKFPEENDDVSVVPTSWLINDKCYWPPYPQTKIADIIRRGEPPEKSWPMFQVTMFRNNVFDSFKEAKKKSIKATVTSELESQPESSEYSSKHRKITKKIVHSFSSFEEENEESFLEEAPSIEKHNTIKNKGRNGIQSQSLQRTSYVREIDSNTKSKVASLNDKSFDNNNNNDSTCELLNNSQLQEIYKLLQQNQHEDTNKELKDMIQKLSRKQNILQSMMMDIGEEVKNLILLIEKQTISNVDETKLEDNLFFKLNLPADTQDELQNLEQLLSDELEFKKAVQNVVVLEGNDVYEFIVRSTGKLITNSCGSQFSYLGRKQKRSFKDLRLWILLLEASKKLFPGNTEKEIEVNIAKWLRRCAERAKKENSHKPN